MIPVRLEFCFGSKTKYFGNKNNQINKTKYFGNKNNQINKAEYLLQLDSVQS